jgi:hypothetical protein
MTGVLTPRLRVDNCFKIFSYFGAPLGKFDFSDSELYDAQWIRGKPG